MRGSRKLEVASGIERLYQDGGALGKPKAADLWDAPVSDGQEMARGSPSTCASRQEGRPDGLSTLRPLHQVMQRSLVSAFWFSVLTAPVVGP